MEQNWLGSQVILPDFVLPSRVNQCWQYSGIDSIEHCLDKTHFKQYPHSVSYRYNSRGFRDLEWPDTINDLKQAIWCVGDSFTVGLGSPIEHTWPWLLQQQTGQRTINVSMDGASNNWIARKTVDILQQINPQYLVIHWSYTSRREIESSMINDQRWNNFYQQVKDQSWPTCDTIKKFDRLPDYIKQEIILVHKGVPALVSDEELRSSGQLNATDQDDLNNTIECINLINHVQTDTKILHTFIPDFSPKSIELLDFLKQQQIPYIPEFTRLDWARDFHHYDILTSQWFVNQIITVGNLFITE